MITQIHVCEHDQVTIKTSKAPAGPLQAHIMERNGTERSIRLVQWGDSFRILHVDCEEGHE